MYHSISYRLPFEAVHLQKKSVSNAQFYGGFSKPDNRRYVLPDDDRAVHIGLFSVVGLMFVLLLRASGCGKQSDMEFNNNDIQKVENYDQQVKYTKPKIYEPLP